MTPRRWRAILRGMNRQERRETERGIWSIVENGRAYAMTPDGGFVETHTVTPDDLAASFYLTADLLAAMRRAPR